MYQLSNREIADVFRAIADRMEVLGDDRYRYLAYRRAGETIADLPMPLANYRERNALEQIDGIGKAIAIKIDTLLTTGKLPLVAELDTRLPASVLELLRVPDLGPKSVRRLYTELGIASQADLRTAIDDGRLRNLKGFGAKTEQRILAGLETLSQQDRRTVMPQALHTAETLLAALQAACPAVERCTYAGSLRRASPTVGDLDLLAASADPQTVIAAFVGLPQVARVDSAGDTKATVALHQGLYADLLVVPDQHWGSALQHFTGSQEHNIRFRRRAQEHGLHFSEWGFTWGDGSSVTCATEDEVYATLGLPWIAPELREGQGEFAAAETRTLPVLIEQANLQADLHMHSTWSDGQATIADMAAAAFARGLRFIAITDHSAYLGVTSGVDSERLRQQATEIAAVNEAYAARGADFQVLRGVEVDITPDGSLALADDVLADLDIVVASLHVSLRQPREQITERALRAIRNPHVDILAHPTGRILERRAGADLDMEAVLQAAATHHTLLEVNSGPDRLDLDPVYVRRALELGASIVVNSDAHHPDNLAWTRYGVLVARRGWAEKQHVANTWSWQEIKAYLAQRPK